MRRYDEYKESGLEWIGEVPKHWSEKRLKEIASIFGGKDYKEIICDNGGFEVFGSGGAFERASRYLYNKESVLLGRKGTIDKPLYVDKPFWVVDTMYYTKIPKITSAKYFYYLSTCIEFGFYRYGSALPSMTQGDLNRIIFFIPQFQEQQAIANYLDAKTQAIDKKVSLLEQKIETYKKLKRTLINQTITKGLRSLSEVEMKDSGISWIGKIPKHWEVKRFKDVLNLFTGNSISDKNGFDYIENSIPYVSTKDIDFNTNEINYENGMYIPNSDKTFKRVKKGTCLLCIEGANAGKKYGILNQEVAFVNKLAALKFIANRNFDKYLYYYIQSIAFSGEFFPLINGLIGGVSINKLKEFNIILPPKSEQEEIAKYLDKKTTTIDAIIDNIVKQIETLKQLRKTLINDVVTGKIKVIE